MAYGWATPQMLPMSRKVLSGILGVLSMSLKVL